MIYLYCDLPVSPPRTHHTHHDIPDTYICQIFILWERKFVKSSTLLRLKTLFLSQWNPGRFDPKFQQTRSLMSYDISIVFLRRHNFGLWWPRAATRPINCFCFCSLFRKGHHCGNKLFPFSVSVIHMEKPIVEHLWTNSHSVYRFTSNEHRSSETLPIGRAYRPWKISFSIAP